MSEEVANALKTADAQLPENFRERPTPELSLVECGGNEHTAAPSSADPWPVEADPEQRAPATSAGGLPALKPVCSMPAAQESQEWLEDVFSSEIPRFRKSERSLHWAVAIPFLVCLASGVAAKLFFNRLHSGLAVHAVLLWVHRGSGILLLLVPSWVAWRHRRDLSLYLYNVKRAWSWTTDDLKWLALIGLASLSKKIALPEQHKFNAGEKINFMSLMLTYPILVATGLALLVPGTQFLSFIVHVGVAVLAAPLIVGHLYMAVVNPDTRLGLSGMFSGRVDREWAKHHYAKWYRENFGEDGKPLEDRVDALEAPAASVPRGTISPFLRRDVCEKASSEAARVPLQVPASDTP